MGFMVKMKARPGMVSVSIGGVTVKVPKSGVVEVPGTAVEDMKCHGLAEVVDESEPKGEQEKAAE